MSAFSSEVSPLTGPQKSRLFSLESAVVWPDGGSSWTVSGHHRAPVPDSRRRRPPRRVHNTGPIPQRDTHSSGPSPDVRDPRRRLPAITAPTGRDRTAKRGRRRQPPSRGSRRDRRLSGLARRQVHAQLGELVGIARSGGALGIGHPKYRTGDAAVITRSFTALHEGPKPINLFVDARHSNCRSNRETANA